MDILERLITRLTDGDDSPDEAVLEDCIEEAVDLFVYLSALFRESVLIHVFQCCVGCPATALHRILIWDAEHQHHARI